mmetsp:Transcript_1699/g.4474  ORF Transcript_1699/g.4474 Transcript_1699/m.4474 type:complete len:121 (+) Transcript_1699:1052-1414(+)
MKGALEEGDKVPTRLIGDCRAGWAKRSRRLLAVEEGAGLLCKPADFPGVLTFVKFPLECLNGLPGVRAGVFDNDVKSDPVDIEVPIVVAVVAVSLLFRLSFRLFDESFVFRMVAGGFRSM